MKIGMMQQIIREEGYENKREGQFKYPEEPVCGHYSGSCAVPYGDYWSISKNYADDILMDMAETKR